ncbi:toxin [Streptomyces cellostaticus]|uniref:Toxin n=1 Tax=Streptomyces cellostaticus TaxID=67285 RepID=A0A117PXU8_9ACTN|nr:toxin [Streptomyces cellostaticus]
MTWYKSTYSSSGDGDCVEVALDWHKSSYSSGAGDNCIEVAHTPTAIHIRDSKDKHGPELALSPATWADFLGYAARH